MKILTSGSLLGTFPKIKFSANKTLLTLLILNLSQYDVMMTSRYRDIPGVILIQMTWFISEFIDE